MSSPPLLALLPVELQREIASYLEFPDNICLRMTCRRFSSVVPPLTLDEVLRAEISAFGFEKNLYACCYCVRLRPQARFADPMTKYRLSKFGRNKGKRVCVQCGVHGTGLYAPGSKLLWNDEKYVVCTACKEARKAPADSGGEETGLCENCWTVPQSIFTTHI